MPPLLSHCSPPASGREASVVTMELPAGASAAETRRAIDQATAILRAAPEVERVYEDPPRPGVASLTIALKPAGERGRSRAAFERSYAPALQAIPGARISFRPQ